MDRLPFFSIIIPTLNSESTLSAAVESILAQKFSDYEILIIDGDSSDNTLHVAKQYRDSRIKVFSEQDEGIYYAMNKGISMAKGKWIYFLGSDDVLFDCDVLEKVAAVTGSKTLLLYGRAKIIPDGIITDVNYKLKNLFDFNICHQAIFYSALLFDRYQYSFDTKFKILADWDLNLKIFSKYWPNRIAYIENIICTFSNTGASHKYDLTREYQVNFTDKEAMQFKYYPLLKYIRIKLNHFKKWVLQMPKHLVKQKG